MLVEPPTPFHIRMFDVVLSTGKSKLEARWLLLGLHLTWRCHSQSTAKCGWSSGAVHPPCSRQTTFKPAPPSTRLVSAPLAPEPMTTTSACSSFVLSAIALSKQTEPVERDALDAFGADIAAASVGGRIAGRIEPADLVAITVRQRMGMVGEAKRADGALHNGRLVVGEVCDPQHIVEQCGVLALQLRHSDTTTGLVEHAERSTGIGDRSRQLVQRRCAAQQLQARGQQRLHAYCRRGREQFVPRQQRVDQQRQLRRRRPGPETLRPPPPPLRPAPPPPSPPPAARSCSLCSSHSLVPPALLCRLKASPHSKGRKAAHGPARTRAPP